MNQEPSSGQTDSPEYDLAISFLAADSALAGRIAGELSRRFKVFIFQGAQDELVGRDGEVEFAKIFGKQARLVLVLYSEGWGSTSWTRIEETAIKSRAFNDGYDFATFAVLRKGDGPPKYLPPTRIWYDFAEYGESGLISVMAARIVEAGGSVRHETLEEKAARKSRSLELQRAHAEFMNSEDGVAAAKAEGDHLVKSLVSGAERIKQGSADLGFVFRRVRSVPHLVGHGLRLGVDLRLEFANTLEGSRLLLQVESGPVDDLSRVVTGKEPRTHWLREYEFERLEDGTTGWRERGKTRAFLPSSKLAEMALEVLLGEVGKA